MRIETLKAVLFWICYSALACGQQPLNGLSGGQGDQVAARSKSEKGPPEANAVEGYIRLDVTVADKEGKPVTGLDRQHFTLLDNGQPLNLVTFHAFDDSGARPDPPTEVILVIDTVNLSPQQVKVADREVESFLHANGGRLSQPMMIYWLSGWGLTRSESPTSDGNALAAEVERGKGPQLVSQQAVRMVEPLLSADYARGRNVFSLTGLGSIVIEERRRPGRKLLLWIGRGWPVESGGEYTFDEVVEFLTRLREARITLSSLRDGSFAEPSYEVAPKAVTRPEEGSPFDLTLEALAIKSGGQVMKPAATLSESIARSIEGANDFYTLTFDPPRTTTVDEYHDLKVKVDLPDVAAQTDAGYYDEPVIYDQAPQLERITMSEVEELLSSTRGRRDEDLARRLNGLELTERMSSVDLAQLMEQMPGPKSRSALAVLADTSAFLKPPKEAILRDPAPDVTLQKQIMARVVDYLAKAIPKLPDFFATRITVGYEEPKQKDEETWKTVSGDRTMHQAQTTSVTMHIRNGIEVAEINSKRIKRGPGRERDLVTEGTFGPILSTVIVSAAAAHSLVEWSRWEQGPHGREAVFSYVVPEETPRFEVGFCCLADPDGTVYFRRQSGFHGEIAIDPESGAILRIMVLADLPPRSPLKRSGVVVEYGPETIGGKVYICPTRSISISRSRTVHLVHEWNESFGVYGPFETMLNDVSFGDYHVFRSTSRILSGMEAVP
jgi:VWFA-related protein